MYRFPPCADRRTPPHSVVRCTDSHLRRPLERQRSSLRPPLPPRPHFACGPGLKSFPAPSAPRLCIRLHRAAGQPTGKSDGGGVGGAGRGRSTRIVGPSCHRFGSSSGASVVYVPIPTLRRPPNAAAFRCTLYRFPPAPTAGTPAQFSPSPASSPSAPACGPGLKSSAAPSHASYVEPALVSTERPASPRGNLMEEEWGVLGGGGRTKSWAPVAIASAHPAERALYMYRFPPCADRRTPPHSVVRCTDSHLRRPLERQRSSLRPPASSPSALCLWARFEKFRRTIARIARRACPRLHRAAGQPTGKSDGGGVGGAGRGRSNKIVGPSCHRFGSSSGASVVYVPIPTLRRPPNAAAFRCTLYRFPPCADRWNASAVLSVPRFLTVRTCVWTRFEKFRRTHRTSALLSSSPERPAHGEI